MASELVFSSIAGSNIPRREKSAIRRWYEGVTGHSPMLSRVKTHVVEGGHALMQGGESLLVGGILGAANAELKHGLDVGDKGNIPADAVAGALLLAGSTAIADSPIAAMSLRTAGSSALSVFAFRKTDELVRRKKGLPTKTLRAAGDNFASDVDIGEDPIIAAAKEL